MQKIVKYFVITEKNHWFCLPGGCCSIYTPEHNKRTRVVFDGVTFLRVDPFLVSFGGAQYVKATARVVVQLFLAVIYMVFVLHPLCFFFTLFVHAFIVAVVCGVLGSWGGGAQQGRKGWR